MELIIRIKIYSEHCGGRLLPEDSARSLGGQGFQWRLLTAPEKEQSRQGLRHLDRFTGPDLLLGGLEEKVKAGQAKFS